MCVLQVKRDEEHKAVQSKDVKDEEVGRIPIAFAMVKLMQTLPPHIMEANLPGYEAVCVSCGCVQIVCVRKATGSTSVILQCFLLAKSNYVQYAFPDHKSVFDTSNDVSVLNI